MDILLFAGTALLARFDAVSFRPSSSSCTKKITVDVLKQQNAVTSTAIIDHYKNSAPFAKLAKYEGDLTIQRDNEDASKLQIGIEFAQTKRVIDPNYVPEPYVKVDVLGKTPEQVANLILERVGSNKGSVIVLVGLSGTGKGTTVTKLRQKLEAQGQTVTCWSNGNIFRSVTLLAATWCEQNCPGGIFDEKKALTKEHVASYMRMLSFGKNPAGHFDTRIQGLGLDTYVSDIQNTTLKSPKVSKNIPTVAQYTQGEVILFAASAVQTLGQAGITVLLEGREQTVNYVRTPYRFTLTLSDESLIGKRRAAQRLMAQALNDMNGKESSVETVLDEALAKMVTDIGK